MTQFAVRHLQLSGKKAYELLRATRALLELPLLAAAFFSGELGWGKIREITRVATGQTDSAWLEFGLAHDTEAVQRQVSMSPAAFRKRSAEAAVRLPTREDLAQASVPADPEQLLAPPSSDLGGRESSTRAPVVKEEEPQISTTQPGPAAGGPVHSGLGEPLIQVVFRLTSAQFAVYQRAEELMRQRRGKRLARAEVLVRLAEEALSAAAPRTRARLPILVRVDASTGAGWLETSEGLYPASSEMVCEALARGKIVSMDRLPGLTDDRLPCLTDEPESTPEPPGVSKPARSRAGRKDVPVAVLQLLWLRSGGSCEAPGCYAGAPLHVHHERPVSDGGDNSLEGLSLRCAACHGLHHEPDFRRRSEWRKARDRHRQRGQSNPVELATGEAVARPP
ncbi:MAG: hypothetical protein AMXMBFR33_73580 [Candidatus Xenobia bacterium]